ncbi:MULTISPECIES: helix-turn-helix domain-containing protein [unclassified Rhodococcus (in: high G+C Gram-positive bacteria)]|uniref:winged helix-turn-helix transcriptional regulator n=1 Tax=unclassified Rhodococcus (in: high G+C Gram-positive bacteria) TaxID=192944 RepID=UPI001BB44629|nr:MULTISPECIES: helix-turn-helix domain-containing protein [unclassified Rhodococcus (in: high G+C Gram-positive bacteria)]
MMGAERVHEEDVGMAGWSEITSTQCPVARSSAVIGDRWTLVIMRELTMGNRRFDTLQVQTLTSPQMLTNRLKRLEADGMLERRAYSERPRRYEYHLTDKGEAFASVLLALRAWGETWCKEPGEEVAVHHIHKTCGREVGLSGPVCEGCGEPFTMNEVTAELSAAFAQEREARSAAARRDAEARRT